MSVEMVSVWEGKILLAKERIIVERAELLRIDTTRDAEQWL